jgi:hypothetical protein
MASGKITQRLLSLAVEAPQYAGGSFQTAVQVAGLSLEHGFFTPTGPPTLALVRAGVTLVTS